VFHIYVNEMGRAVQGLISELLAELRKLLTGQPF
jgi:hypothetical protein